MKSYLKLIAIVYYCMNTEIQKLTLNDAVATVMHLRIILSVFEAFQFLKKINFLGGLIWFINLQLVHSTT